MKTSVKEIMQDSVRRWAKAEEQSILHLNWQDWKQPPLPATGKVAADVYGEEHGGIRGKSELLRIEADEMLAEMREDHIDAVCRRYGVTV